MEYPIELGEIADMATGKLTSNGALLVHNIPQIANNIGLPLDQSKTRTERHCGMMLGGEVYVRYVLVAPEGVNEAEWLTKAKELEKLVGGFL